MSESPARLACARVTLRPMSEADLPEVQHWRSDPEVTRYWITREVPSLEQLSEWLQENRRQGSWTWAIESAEGDLIGYSDVFGINLEHRHAELSIMIGDRSQWGKGYGKAALLCLLDHLLSPAEARGAGLHKVSLSVFDENTGARALYRSCGFREDGVLREDMWYDGEWHNQVLMSVLEHEFAELKRH